MRHNIFALANKHHRSDSLLFHMLSLFSACTSSSCIRLMVFPLEQFCSWFEWEILFCRVQHGKFSRHWLTILIGIQTFFFPIEKIDWYWRRSLLTHLPKFLEELKKFNIFFDANGSWADPKSLLNESVWYNLKCKRQLLNSKSIFFTEVCLLGAEVTSHE